MKSKLTYVSSGVDYNRMDPVKRMAQNLAKQTSKNLTIPGFKVIEDSRGEAAFVWEEQDSYRALVIEGLGTKNLVADAMYQITGKSYYLELAQDTVAAIANDIIVVGAKPQVVTAYFGLGSSKWLDNQQRTKDLLEGWAKACNLAGVTWGGGETPTLGGIINPETIDLAGSGIGIIKPKMRLTLGGKLTEGDVIVLISSSGIHANGITLARKVAEKLPEGYATKLTDGTSYGETLLKPTHLYTNLVQDLFDQGVNIHYLVNITGHGWRKLMRAKSPYNYIINNIPTPQEVFDFIQKNAQVSDEEMYGNFNMGAGFAIFLPEDQVKKAQEIINDHNLKSWKAGWLEKGEKQVIIKPKNITFKGESLGVR